MGRGPATPEGAPDSGQQGNEDDPQADSREDPYEEERLVGCEIRETLPHVFSKRVRTGIAECADNHTERIGVRRGENRTRIAENEHPASIGQHSRASLPAARSRDRQRALLQRLAQRAEDHGGSRPSLFR